MAPVGATNPNPVTSEVCSYGHATHNLDLPLSERLLCPLSQEVALRFRDLAFALHLICASPRAEHVVLTLSL